MAERDPHRHTWEGPRRYRWDSPEFARVTSLSDGVFAIALTLLVLTLEVPDVGSDDLATALLAEAPQIALFALSFLLVANIWWVHHRFYALLGELEAGLIVVNFCILGFVALVPFPTSLVGKHPTASAAVAPFIFLFLAITLLYALALLRARHVNAWREPLPHGLFGWFMVGWLVHAGGMLTALILALMWPVAGLCLLAVWGPLAEATLGRLAPAEYRRWAP